jgi:hypothetical protein
VIIHVSDHNDHPPKFLSNLIEGRVFESAAIGTSVVEAIALDSDKGENAEISYSILTERLLKVVLNPISLTLTLILKTFTITGMMI